MGFRTSGMLLLVAVLLGAFVYLYELRDGEQQTAAGQARRLFPGLSAEDVERISIATSDGRRAELERGGEGWRLQEPVRFEADQVAVEAIASQLAQLEVEGRVERGGGRPPLAEFGLADGDAELRFTASGAEHYLRIGRKTPVGGNTYVTTDGAAEVAYVATWRTNVLRKSLSELRDRRVLDFDQSRVAAIRVRWPEGGVELERRGGTWWLVRPVEERADSRTVDTLLSDLAFLRADGFIDPGDAEAPAPDALGLEAPRLEIVLAGETDDGSRFERAVVFGAARDERLVTRGRGGALYWVAAQRLEELPRVLVDYRFKQLSRFDVADARRFELDFAGADGERSAVRGELEAGVWRTTPLAMAPGRIGAMLAELADLEGRDIVADALGEAELAALGLAPPRVRIAVFGADGGSLAALSLGLLQPDSGLLAQRSDSAVVHRLDPQLADQIPIDLAALEERFLADEDEALGPGADEPAPIDEAP